MNGHDVARTREFEWLARAGIAARGVIYAIIGVLATRSGDSCARRDRSRTGGQ